MLTDSLWPLQPGPRTHAEYLRLGNDPRRLYWIPTIVCILGIASLVMLLWTNRIGRIQRSHFAYANAVMDLRISLATSHLWLEEAITGRDPAEMDRARSDLREATRLSTILLSGGESEHDLLVPPIGDPQLRGRAQEIRRLVADWTAMFETRAQRPEVAGEGSVLENRTDAMFNDFQRLTADLETLVEGRMAADHARSRKLFLAMLLLWLCIVASSTTCLVYWGRSRKHAEAALENAARELESRVAARTEDLRRLNEQMREELGARREVEAQVRESERQLRQLSTRLLVAQEEERSRISKELHDGLGNFLILIKLRLGEIRRQLRGERRIARQSCADLSDLIDRVIEDVRRLSRDLRPSVFDDLGLSGALRWLMESSLSRKHAIVGLSSMDIDHLFAPDAQVVLFRIVQEALSNVEKHAGAAQVILHVARDDGRISFTVEDDGKGFDVAEAIARKSHEKGLGLATMNERARILGGTISLWSEQGKGTRITLVVPVTEVRSREKALSNRTSG